MPPQPEQTAGEPKTIFNDSGTPKFKIVGGPPLTEDEARAWLAQPVTPGTRAQARTINSEEVQGV